MHSSSFYSITLKSILILSIIYISAFFLLRFPNKNQKFQHYKNIHSTVCRAGISLYITIFAVAIWNLETSEQKYILKLSRLRSTDPFSKDPLGLLCNRVQRHPVEDRAAVTKHSTCREHGFMGMHKTTGVVTGTEILHFVPFSSLTSRYFKLSSFTKTANLGCMGIKVVVG
jgi:hypothetical protein